MLMKEKLLLSVIVLEANMHQGLQLLKKDLQPGLRLQLVIGIYISFKEKCLLKLSRMGSL
jgi:hypothetical protein